MTFIINHSVVNLLLVHVFILLIRVIYTHQKHIICLSYIFSYFQEILQIEQRYFERYAKKNKEFNSKFNHPHIDEYQKYNK